MKSEGTPPEPSAAQTSTTAPRPTTSLVPPGRQLGRFKVGRRIGEGAQATVYEAEDEAGDRVALKVIHRHLLGDPQIFKRFHREAAILKRLEGDHVVRFVDFVEEDGLLVIALAYVGARTLEDELRDANGPLEIGQAVEIALQICAALGTAHAAGIVHRDLKPSNVLLTDAEDEGAPPHVRVADFGLARVLHGEHMSTGLTEQNMIFGTPEYMAPEQARGDEADGRADLYAAGVILYEMLVGAVPFQARTPLGTMTAQLTEAPPSPRARAPHLGISAALEVVIHRALAKSPQDRYASARAFAEALASARKRDVVITNPGVDDVASLSTSDTDLEIVPPDPAPRSAPGNNPAPRIDETQPSPVLRRLRDSLPDAAPPSAVRRDGRFWMIVAVVAAVIGVTVGVLIGAR